MRALRGIRRRLAGLLAVLWAMVCLAGCAAEELTDPLAAYDGAWYFAKNAVECQFGDGKIYRDDNGAKDGQTLAGIYIDGDGCIKANLANTGAVHVTRTLYIVSTDQGDVLCDSADGSGTIYFYRDPLAAMAALEETQQSASPMPEDGGDTPSPAKALPSGEDAGSSLPPETYAPEETPAAVRGPVDIAPEPAAETAGGQVWVSQSGKRYHRDSGCSGMKDPSQLTQQEAERKGYTPCKRCY